VSELSDINKMSPSNLGVVFGPTLIKPQMTSASSLNNLSHHNFIGAMVHMALSALISLS
jgi:hypothetical protein